MTETFLTPDVYQIENDRSYIAPGQAATGLAIIGPTQKGEAFIPTDVVSYGDFTNKFGSDAANTYVPQTVLNYLSAGSSVKVTRVLGNGGWNYTPDRSLVAIVKEGVPYTSASVSTALVTTSSLLTAISGSGQTAIMINADTSKYFYGFDPTPVLVSGSVVSDVKATSLLKFNAVGGKNSNIQLTLNDPLSGSFTLASFYQSSSSATISDIVNGVSASIATNSYGYTVAKSKGDSLELTAPTGRGALLNGTLISKSQIVETKASASVLIETDDVNFNNIQIWDSEYTLYLSRYTTGLTLDEVGVDIQNYINQYSGHNASYNASTDILNITVPPGKGVTANGTSLYVQFRMITPTTSTVFKNVTYTFTGGIDGTYSEKPAIASVAHSLGAYKRNFPTGLVTSKLIITDVNNAVVDILGDYTAVSGDVDDATAAANFINDVNTLGNKGYTLTYNPSNNTIKVQFKPGFGSSANNTGLQGYNAFAYYYTPSYVASNGSIFNGGIDGANELSVSLTPFDGGVTANTGSLVVVKGNANTDALGSVYFANTGSNTVKLNSFINTLNSYQDIIGVTSSLSGSFIKMVTTRTGSYSNGYYAGNASSVVSGRVADVDKFKFSGGQDEVIAVEGGIVKVLHPSNNENIEIAHIGNSIFNGTPNSFTLQISGSQINKFIDASLIKTDSKYIGKLLGTDASFSENSAFLYLNFENENVSNLNNIRLIKQESACSFTSSYEGGYDAAETPWIFSESNERLFKFVHRSHGLSTNKDIKVSITNISKNSESSIYSKFNIIVRKWNDTDRRPSILEQFVDVDLNPNSANYIGRIIGDKYKSYDSNQGKVIEYGNYPNNSNFIRVEIYQAVENAKITANVIPNGHETMFETIAGFNSVYKLPYVRYVYSNSGSFVYSGFDYSNPDNLNYLNPVPFEASYGNNSNFIKPASDNKFTIPLQGGTDGMNFGTIKKSGAEISSDGSNLFGFDLSTSAAAGSLSYAKAINILSNNQEHLFNLLVMPGVIEEYHSTVTALAESMVETRADAVYIRDLTGENSSINVAANLALGLDSSYSAVYYPWVKVRELNSPKNSFVPPSVVVPQAYAYTDRVRAPWYAPAGVVVGVLGGVMEAKVKLTKPDTDILYSTKVNPITKVIGSPGVAIMGQKTLQNATTALRSINVRRLMIELRGYIVNVAKTLLFDQNTAAVRNSFLDKINPYLENVQQKEGIYGYRVVLDETNNPADVIDRNQLVCQIYIYPTKSIEYVLLEFNIEPTSGLTNFNNV